MEIGHNVMHGQWDWMNDPEIHSSNWEWDTAQPAEQWKHSHNYVHHQFTNVLGYDNDIGYGILRMAREQKWHPVNLGQPVYNALLASLFQWGVALHDLDIERIRKGEKDPKEMKRQLRQIVRKGRNQILKDYVVYPALSGRQWRTTMTANATANLTRNLWSYVIIFCGHFPDGAMHFTEEELEDETRAEWYLRQILGRGELRGRPAAAHPVAATSASRSSTTSSPTCPSNRYAEISVRVRALCDKYDIPYTTGPLHRQYGQALRTIIKLSLPNRMTTSDDPAPPERPDTADEPARGPPAQVRRRAAAAAHRAGRVDPQPARAERTTDGRRTAALRRAAPRRASSACRCRSPAAPTRTPARDGAGLGRGARRPAGHPVRAEPGLRGLRGRPGPAARASWAAADEADRNAFHFPACHLECARRLLDALAERPRRRSSASPSRWRRGCWSPHRAFEYRPAAGSEDVRPHGRRSGRFRRRGRRRRPGVARRSPRRTRPAPADASCGAAACPAPSGGR